MPSSLPEEEALQSPIKVAVLMACHNRRELTIRCLTSLYAARPEGWNLIIHLVDDGSSDGTTQAVKVFDPNIKIIQGNGNWYWAHSMYQAEMAIEEPHDAILWVNDDIQLAPSALLNIDKYFSSHPNQILVGQFKDQASQELSYGGYYKYGKRPFQFKRAYTSDELISVDTFNGNLVFIPSNVSEIVGHIDGGFAHGTADIDFGLRARRAGVSMKVIPEFAGTCDLNPVPEFKTFTSELKALLDRKTFPISSQVRFYKKHGSIFSWIFILTPFLRIFLKHSLRLFNELLRKTE